MYKRQADGSGKLYAGEFKTIKGKKYAFRNDGRMLSGLKFIKEGTDDFAGVVADDDDNHSFDNEDDFLAQASTYFEGEGYKCCLLYTSGSRHFRPRYRNDRWWLPS